MLNIKWTDKIPNRVVLQQVEDERSLLAKIKERQKAWVGHVLKRTRFSVIPRFFAEIDINRGITYFIAEIAKLTNLAVFSRFWALFS